MVAKEIRLYGILMKNISKFSSSSGFLFTDRRISGCTKMFSKLDRQRRLFDMYSKDMNELEIS